MNETDPAPRLRRQFDLHRTEKLLGNLLRFGVMASAVLLVAGVMVSLIRHPDYLTDPAALAPLTDPEGHFPHVFQDLMAELARGRGRAIMTLGLLVLILTPIMRVAVSVVAFSRERDWTFTVITSCVLCILILSFLIGRIE